MSAPNPIGAGATINGAASTGGGGGPVGSAAVTIWRPGVPSAGNAVATWAEVETAIAATSGNITVQLDCSFATPAPIPGTADTQAFGRVRIESYTPNDQELATIEVADGGRIRNLGALRNVAIAGAPTTQPFIEQSTAAGLLIADRGAVIRLKAGATKPAAQVTATINQLALFEGAWLDNQTGNPALPVVAIDPALVFIFAVLGIVEAPILPTGNAFPPNALSGAGTSTLIYLSDASAPFVPQPNFAGTITKILCDRAAGVTYDDIFAPTQLGAATVQAALDLIRAYWYTPAASGAVNCTVNSVSEAQWMKIGKDSAAYGIVLFSGRIEVAAINAALPSSVNIALPIPSSGGGQGVANTAYGPHGKLAGYFINLATLEWQAIDTSISTFAYQFMYRTIP